MKLIPLLLAATAVSADPGVAPKPPASAGAGPSSREILLWENGPPGEIKGAHKAWPGVGAGGVPLISNIGIPSIVLHQPAAPGANRRAVILCPGGAYQALAAVEDCATIEVPRGRVHVVSTFADTILCKMM